MLDKLGQQQDGFRVTRSYFDELSEQFLVLALLHGEVVLSRCHFALDCLDALVEVVLEVSLVIVDFSNLGFLRLAALEVLDLFLKLRDLLFVLLDHLLAEVGAFRELLLHFAVVCEVSR